MLPARRKQPKFGTVRAPRRHWPRHEKWVRGFDCSVPGCGCAPIEFAHLRLGAKDNGIGIKPPSWFGISLCVEHHREAHRIGEMSFQRRHGIDWLKLASEFARRSPDVEMRKAMKDA
jgi:hypothetical protein